MPIVLHKSVGSGWLALWQITESEQELQELVLQSDRDSLYSMNSPARRCERLAWRAALRHIIPDAQVAYNIIGAPELIDCKQFISASHTQQIAAVITCQKPCAIDIESTDRNFDRVKTRYISSEESLLPQSQNSHFEAAIWCAKETLYKLSGRNELNFRGDIHITRCDFDRNEIDGKIENGDIIVMKIEFFDNYIITYTL